VRQRTLLPDPDIFKRVRRIEIRTRRLVTETLSGTYNSAFRGRGMEFAEVREYQPGDDVRSIDWNVTSRSSRPERKLFVKLFNEERELTVVLMADASSSGAFGTGPRLKREVIAEIAALLSFAAIRNRDRVGLVLFSDRIERYLSPRRGRMHALRVVREVLTAPEGRRSTDLAGALSFLRRVQKRPAVVFLLSDMIAPDFSREAKLVARRHDLVALEVVDPAETHLPAAGVVLLEDAETGARRLVDTSSRELRAAIEARSRERRERIRELCSRAGIDRFTLDAAADYDRALERYFRLRSARIRR
jgi:uncharacterized protein (DUF58 family)